MLDQSFSVGNFRKIFDYENRKGVYLEGKFFPNIDSITKQIREHSSSIRRIRKSMKDSRSNNQGIPPDFQGRLTHLSQTVEQLKTDKEAALIKKLEEICEKVSAKTFSIHVEKSREVNGKQVFEHGGTPEEYFVLKQVQRNIRRVYSIKQANRSHVVSQLREALRDKFPKHIVRTDISSFYESIPRDRLLRMLNRNPLLTLTSKKVIKQLLFQFNRVSDGETGVPRGIGVSSYLAELYLTELDRQVTEDENLIYYGRYVDDIVAVYSQEPNGATLKQLNASVRRRIGDLGLTINEGKSCKYSVPSSHKQHLDYLGYRFEFGDGEVHLDLGKRKTDKYRERINLVFDAYCHLAPRNEKKARQLLRARLRFLTGNTRLVNNKRNAVVGIYFSNSHLTRTTTLRALDDTLNQRIAGLPVSQFSNRLKKYSFEKGFTQRTFRQFSIEELSLIVGAWDCG